VLQYETWSQNHTPNEEIWEKLKKVSTIMYESSFNNSKNLGFLFIRVNEEKKQKKDNSEKIDILSEEDDVFEILDADSEENRTDETKAYFTETHPISEEYIDYIEDTVFKKYDFNSKTSDDYTSSKIHIQRGIKRELSKVLFADEENSEDYNLELDTSECSNINFNSSSIFYSTETQEIKTYESEEAAELSFLPCVYKEYLPALITIDSGSPANKDFLLSYLKKMKTGLVRKKYKLRDKNDLLRKHWQRIKDLQEMSRKRQREIDDFMESPFAKIKYVSYTGEVIAKGKIRKRNIDGYRRGIIPNNKATIRVRDGESQKIPCELRKQALERRKNWILKWLDIGLNKKNRELKKIFFISYRNTNRKELLERKKELLKKKYLESVKKEKEKLAEKQKKLQDSSENKGGWNNVFENNTHGILFTEIISDRETEYLTGFCREL
jgi:hypothetical protein